MKRLLINISLIALFAGTFTACKKQIADDYNNPELSQKGSMSKLLSGMFINKRMRPSYWDYATFILPTTAAYSQTTALQPGSKMYIPSLSYTENRWVDFYAGAKSDDNDLNYVGPGIMANFREMQTTYAALTPAQQADQLVFMNCGKVLLFDQTAQMVDLWGDIPFGQAGSLNTPDRNVNPAAFQDATAIYDTLITGLDNLNSYFAAAQLKPEIQASLTKADFVLTGSLDAWRRYANSLRLRLLMRTSFVNEARSKAAVSDMLNNPAKYPLIASNDENVLVPMSPNALKSDVKDALTGSPYAPAFMLDTMMLANNDPRTDVYWDKGTIHGWAGFPANGGASDYEAGGYATYDSATFFYNYNIPGVIFTASEVSFLKAEAGERWGLGTPQASYKSGITQSIAFYYTINKTAVLSSGSWKPLTSPTDSAISAFLGKPAIAYTGTQQQKLAKIWTQKWMNCFILQSGEAWAELRRTSYPKLTFALASTSGASTPPQRLLYPSTEQVYNPDNYAKVAAKDKADIKIFWDVR
ncbi:SusD-like starch-binding protein associating with outer membrane [Chitinophaga polysaccharea]|uniref:SusD-like starch-binding protein associating with outer membrane n=1 Tax=Chitinophaga polysaccharea TaxID=1293035 RepID=A0A561PGI0_9BACT|nr:SusD/RagB family nutrient-binding outer membrane lipoprotein [Chitinophaga polysaccharea]TWF37205.1 SusD-like starch-binding protein associating with outer membrane [Chitinophaga polysaccharea]